MPLDLAVLGSDGTPADVVPIRASVHERLMLVAQQVRASLLLRMSDFYLDAEYGCAELPALGSEVEQVMRAALEDQELGQVLQQAKGLLHRALLQGAAVVAIAD